MEELKIFVFGNENFPQYDLNSILYSFTILFGFKVVKGAKTNIVYVPNFICVTTKICTFFLVVFLLSKGVCLEAISKVQSKLQSSLREVKLDIVNVFRTFQKQEWKSDFQSRNWTENREKMEHRLTKLFYKKFNINIIGFFVLSS